MPAEVLVCYLVAPGDAYALKAVEFTRSFAEHSPGMAYDQLIVYKSGTRHLPAPWTDYVRQTGVAKHSNEGWDIASLLRVCSDYANYPFIMWLGANCRILHAGWLPKFHEYARRQPIGAVGPNGSWEAGITGESPNPHLRTHCLMVKPWVINSLGFGLVHTRRDCYEFEHGHQSLYRRLRAQGLDSVVVGADGRAYFADGWPQSRTYRTGDQENLLIADKMTDMFAAADRDERIALAAMAGWTP